MKDDLERCFCVVNVSSVVLLYNVVDRLCCREWFCFDRYQSWLWPLFAAKKELVGSFEISAPMYQIIQRHNSPSISLSVCLSVTHSKPITSSYGLISKHIGSGHYSITVILSWGVMCRSLIRMFAFKVTPIFPLSVWRMASCPPKWSSLPRLWQSPFPQKGLFIHTTLGRACPLQWHGVPLLI